MAEQVDVGFTYLSRVENGRLNYGDYPSNALIHRLANAFDADEEELQVLAERVHDRIRQRVLQRPDVFGKLADLDVIPEPSSIALLGYGWRRKRKQAA